MRPKLFLLSPGFTDGGRGPYFCPDTAYVEGYLACAAVLDIRRIPFEKPRMEVVELLGKPNQSCPVYVFPDGEEAPPDAEMSPVTGQMFISDSRRHKTVKPHG